MRSPLLTTKLHFPSTRSSLVPRPRLLALLERGLQGPLTLVSAPAGYGKTTLLAAWRSGAGSEVPVAWLSLDREDNDILRFLAYFATAFDAFKAGIRDAALAIIQSPQPPSPQTILTALINDLVDTLPTPCVLVLDDYHVITSQPVNDAMTFLLDHQPSQVRLVLLTRADPSLPLALLRARNHLTEIRAADLCFTIEEATIFLNQIMGLALTKQQVEALEQRTEGWIAGLQLAAISMQGLSDRARLISTFTGSHHYIMDYLVDEVVDRQPEPVRSFMLQTSILEKMTGSLCEALTQRADGQAMLELLERANLFVAPLDDERNWYRYHPLFSDVLGRRMKQANPEQFADLHLRAAGWYEQNQFLPEALHHALTAGDQDYAAHLVEQNALPMLLQGELTLLLDWLAKVEMQVSVRPWLTIYRAWAQVHTGQQEKAAALLDQLEQSELKSVTPLELREIRGHMAAIRAHIAAYRWDGDSVVTFARLAFDLLPEDHLPIRSFVAQVLGGAYLLKGDLAQASRGLAEARRLGKAADNLHVAVLATYMLANLQADQGQLHLAVETFHETLQLATTQAGQLLPVAARAYNGLGRVYYEWNDLEAVSQFTEQCIAFARKWGNINALVSACVSLARVYQARGDLEGAQSCLDEAGRFAHEHTLAPGGASGIEIVQVGLWLATGNLGPAARWAKERGFMIDEVIPPLREAEYQTFVRVLLAQNRTEEALMMVGRLLPAAESAGKRGAVIELLILQALALQAKEDTPQALESVKRALALAQPEGYLRVFLDVGAPMQKLLRQAGSRGIAARYVARLLAEFDRIHGASVPSQQPLVEPLSERELEVLGLIAAGLSNQEIAQKLIVARGTVKAHTANIYRKLDVVSRTQAVARALELNLLSKLFL